MFTVMKKFLILIVLIAAFTGGAILASDVSNADYMTKITVSNNSTSAQSGKVAAFTLSTSSYISAGMLNSSANDCAMRTGLSGTDIPFMPGWGANPWCSFVDTIGASTSKFQYLYSHNATGGKLVWFPGTYGGNVTDVAPLEPANNCRFDFTVPITSTSFDILSKSGAFSLLSDGSGNVTASVPGGVYPTVSSNTTGCSLAAVPAIAVTFPAGVVAGDGVLVLTNTYNGTVTVTTPSGWLKLYESTGYGGSASSMAAFWIKATAPITSQNFTTSASAWNDWAAFKIAKDTFTGTPVVGTTATGNSANPDPPINTTGFGALKTLFIAVENNFGAVTASSAPANYLYLQNISELAGAGQNIAVAFRYLTAASDNPGQFTIGAAVNWGAQTIAIQGGSMIICSISGLTAGTEAVGYFIQDGVNAWINVNGSTSANSTAVAIADNTNPWVWGAGAPYIYGMEHYVAGVIQGAWEWEYTSGNFTDATGHGYGLAPSYCTASSSGISALVTSSEGTYEGTVPVVGVDSGWTMITAVPSAPSGMFTDGGTGFPLGPQISTVAEDAGDEPENWITLFAMALAIVAFVGIYATTHNTRLGQKGSLILASLCAEFVLVYFYIVSAISGLSLIPAGILLVFLVFWRKSSAPVD